MQCKREKPRYSFLPHAAGATLEPSTVAAAWPVSMFCTSRMICKHLAIHMHTALQTSVSNTPPAPFLRQRMAYTRMFCNNGSADDNGLSHLKLRRCTYQAPSAGLCAACCTTQAAAEPVTMPALSRGAAINDVVDARDLVIGFAESLCGHVAELRHRR